MLDILRYRYPALLALLVQLLALTVIACLQSGHGGLRLREQAGPSGGGVFGFAEQVEHRYRSRLIEFSTSFNVIPSARAR